MSYTDFESEDSSVTAATGGGVMEELPCVTLLLVPDVVGLENFGGAGGGGIDVIKSVIQSMLFAPCIVYLIGFIKVGANGRLVEQSIYISLQSLAISLLLLMQL